MATLNYPRHFQFSRDYVINSISFAGQGTNKGLEGPKKGKDGIKLSSMAKHVCS